MNVKPLYKWRIPASNNNSLPVSTVECTASDSIAVLPVDTAGNSIPPQAASALGERNPAGEVMRVTEAGALRADVGKVPLHLVPPEVMKLALPAEYHGFIDWFHGSGTVDDLRMCARVALGDQRGVLAVARVWEVGAKKYAAWNWFKGLLFSNLYNSAMRHALKAQYETIDRVEDGGTGEPHTAHYAWNVCVCYVFAMQGRTELDDRAACAQPPRAA